MEDATKTHPNTIAAGSRGSAAATTPSSHPSKPPSARTMPENDTTDGTRYRYTLFSMPASDIAPPGSPPNQEDARRWPQQPPNSPFYTTTGPATSRLSSPPPDPVTNPPRKFPGVPSCSRFGLATADPSDSMLVERGSPPSTLSPMAEENWEQQHRDKEKVRTTTSRSSQKRKSTQSKRDITHTERNDEGSQSYVPDYAGYRLNRVGQPSGHWSTLPLNNPPYASQLDDLDLSTPDPTQANGLESRDTHRQQPSGSFLARNPPHQGDIMVESNFVYLSPSDAEEEWTKVSKNAEHY